MPKKQYEDTGLTPEEVAELVQAKKEGRLVVLPQTLNEDYDGLKVKYRVYKARNNEPVEDCFVLRPYKDYASREALLTYAENCGNQQLANDIETWVELIISDIRREVACTARHEAAQAALEAQEETE